MNTNADGQVGGAYTIKDQADEARNYGQRIARVKVSYTQGQLDE